MEPTVILVVQCPSGCHTGYGLFLNQDRTSVTVYISKETGEMYFRVDGEKKEPSWKC